MSLNSSNIHTSINAEEFIKKINETIIYHARKNIKEKESFTFVLSGGNTPKDIFIDLAKNHKNSIDWRKVHFFWLDERCVSPAHKDSNYKLAYDYLISKLDSVGSVHRIKGEIEPNQAAREYREDVVSFFGSEELKFDLILLGMGEDGHIGSIFPNSEEVKETTTMIVYTKKKYGLYYRISLGLDVINGATYKLLILKSLYKKNVLLTKGNLPVHQIEYNKIIFGDLD